MEALSSLQHTHQPQCSSIHYHSPSPSISPSLFLSQPSSPSPSIRASSSSLSSSSSSPPSDSPVQNLQYPEPKTPQIFNPLPKLPSFDPPIQYPEAKSSHIFNTLRKLPSFATITAASAFLILGFCQKGFTSKALPSLSSVVSIQEELLDEKTDIGDFLGSKPDHGHSVLLLKLKERVPVVHSFDKMKSDDEEEAWQVLKAQVFSCSEKLELVKVGFEEILESDQDCHRAHHDCIFEYLEMVDKCTNLLKGIKVAISRCERQNADIRSYLRFFSKVLARIRVFERDMVGALKYYKELEQE